VTRKDRAVRSEGKRHERRAAQRALDRARGNTILLRPRPSLFFAVREQARKEGLSIPLYVLAVLHETHMEEDQDIFTQSPEEIRRKVRG
jgi:hypothetical protein